MSEKSGHGATEFAKSPMKVRRDFLEFSLRATRGRDKAVRQGSMKRGRGRTQRVLRSSLESGDSFRPIEDHAEDAQGLPDHRYNLGGIDQMYGIFGLRWSP